MNEKRLFDSLVEIQKDLTTVINKMKSLSMDDAFVTHCDFILNNMTILKAVSALKIAVQSYNVYQKPSDELEGSPSDMGFDILPEATLDSFVDDDDNNDVSDIMASLESDASDLIKKEKGDDADYDPREETRRKQSPVRKTKGKRGPKPKSRSSIVTKTGRGRSGQQSDPSVEIEYTCPACYMPFKHLVRFKRHIDTYHKDLNVDADSCKTVIDVATASPIVTVLRHSTGDTNGTPQVELMEADGQASPPTFDDLAQDQGDGTYLCIVCNKTLDSEASMKEHAEFHSEDTSFNCTVCEKGFTTASTLRCHMKTHGYGNRFKCSYCSKEFMTKTFRDDHENAEHTGASRFKCDMCNRVFKEAWKLKVHMMKHTGARPYKCSICEKAFHTNAELRVHTKTHNDDMDALCTICGKTFKNRSALNSHMKRHEGERDFTCKICGKNWYSKGALTEHMMVHSDERPFQCTECGTCFKKNSALNKHMDSHRGLRTKCQHCDEEFPSHYQCRRHELSHREGGNPFVCKYCGKQFDGGTKLRAHVNVHEGIRPYPCTICDKSFFDKKAQKEHIMIHTGIRPFPCTICDKSFFNKKALKEHTMIHTGEKRHKCKYCGSSYTQSSTLGKHIKTVHATEYAAEGVTLVEAFQNKIKEARSKGILVGTIGFRKAIKVGGPEGEGENMDSNMDSNKSDEDALAETEAAAPADVLQAPDSPPHPTADPSFAGLNLVKEPSSGPPAALAAPLDYGTPSIIGQSHQRALLQQQQQQQAAALQETYNSVSSLFQLPGTQYYY